MAAPHTDGREPLGAVVGAAPIGRCTAFADLPEFLSPEEFGAHVGLSRNTTYDLLRRHEIRHVRFGRQIRIPKAVLRDGTDADAPVGVQSPFRRGGA